MIESNPKKWTSFIFKFHKSDTIRKLFPLLIVMGLYTAGIVFIMENHTSDIKNEYLKNITVTHSLLGFVISMLLVFRTNSAYDRWWEGRKQWGALVNSSRSLAIKLSAILAPEDEKDRNFFKKMIPAFAFSLRNHLKSENTRIELFELKDEDLSSLENCKHIPNQISSLINKRVANMHRQGQLSGEQLLFINNELIAFNDVCGACERIKNTPIPYSYSAFLQKFIFIYVLTLPIGYAFTLSYYLVPVIVFVFYVLASLELIAEEIEDPFGEDANDIPTEKIAQTIEKNIQELL